jgi:hypothetical protein
VCFIVYKTTSELELVILTTPLLVGAENTNSWRTRKEGLQHAFSLDIPMVPSSRLAFFANGEHLTCSGFSLSETICFGIFEIVGEIYPRYCRLPVTAHNSRCDRFAPAVNDWGTIHLIPRNGPTTLG